VHLRQGTHNSHVENRIRPVALWRSNWLFAGSLRAGQRAANIMSLIQSAELKGQDPYRYLKDVLERLPTQPARRIDELLLSREAFHSEEAGDCRAARRRT
jgi:transposase